MSEQKLDSSEVPRPAVDQHRLRATQRVRAEFGWVEPDAGHPLLDESGVLPGREADAIATAFEEELTWLPTGQPQVVVDGHPRLVPHLEPHGHAGLLLPDRRAVHRVSARSHVINTNGDHVTAA